MVSQGLDAQTHWVVSCWIEKSLIAANMQSQATDDLVGISVYHINIRVGIGID